MSALGLSLLLFLATTAASVSISTAQTCNACNCQFNNLHILNQLIDAQVSQILSSEPRKLFAEFQI